MRGQFTIKETCVTRIHISLDGCWDFFPDPQGRLSHQSLKREGARRIQVPGPWQAQFADMRQYSGVAWYRRTFELPAMREDRDGQPVGHNPSLVAILRFGAVDYYTQVWLNGTLIGEHEGGYLPFELPLGDALQRDGANELIVRVLDPGADTAALDPFPFDEIPHGKQSWYGPIGGIWQSVSLEMRHATYITRLQATPDVPGEQVSVAVYLNRPADRRYALALTITDPLNRDTRCQATIDAGQSSLQTLLPTPDPLLWDTRSPQLYQLAAELLAGDGELALDATAARFGMRTIATSPDGRLMLNGRILYLRGALDQDYYPNTIYTPFSDAELEEQFIKAKHMGLNCLRTHIKITDPRYYDAADRIGILIWTELPNWEHLTDAAKRRARETLTGMVERDWNHPAIIIWTIINEGWGVDLAVNADHRAWLADTYAYLKALDPNRLIVGNSPCFSTFHVVTDIEDFHNYYAIPDHYREWRDWVQVFASRPPWTFAHSYENINSWHEFMRDPWNPLPRTAAPEVVRRGNEPMVVSEFGNWGLPDVDLLRACYDGQEPWWFETGIEWSDGVVYPHGIEQRFKAFHLDKVFPTLSDLAQASQRMQFTALKYQIEQMRRFPSIVGYIITEFTDVHWECNGLLDQCRNPKAFYNAIGQVNSADAIVPDWDRVVFWEGERCEVRLILSHFSSDDLRGSRLEWQLDLWPQIGGSFEGLQPIVGQVAGIGTVIFEMPDLEQSVRARLELRLIDATGTLVTSNHHELYVFPRRLAEPPAATIWAASELAQPLSALGYRLTDDIEAADVALVNTMTDDMRWHLQRGGRVLWLAESSESKQTWLGSLGVAQRRGRSWQGDWASNLSWIRQDQMFKDIPSGGLVDFAFADLTPDHVIVGLRPRDFATQVHAGLSVGWLHQTVALVAERRFGGGLLLIATFNLSAQLQANPVARIMLGDMIRHLARTPQARGADPAEAL